MKFKFMLILSLLVFSLQGMEQENESKAKKNVINAYLAVMGGITAHELGHVIVGKKLFNCRALFFVAPWVAGGTIFYRGSLLKFLKALKENRESYIEKAHLSLMNKMNNESKKEIGMLLAGPFAGMAYAGILPFLNTVYEEYKHYRNFDKKYGTETSVKNVLSQALEQPYINNIQDGGIVVGSIFSFLQNFYNLLPSFKGCDGDRILDCLRINRHRSLIRYSAKCLPWAGLSFLVAQDFFKDKV